MNLLGRSRRPGRRRTRAGGAEGSDHDRGPSQTLDEGVYDGPADIAHEEERITARIRVQGHLDPLDGRFHWAGIAFGDEVRALKDARVTTVDVAVDGRPPVTARLAEITPWETVRITGIGAPPYPLDDAELVVRA